MRDWKASEDGGSMLVDEAVVVWLHFSYHKLGWVMGKRDARGGIGPHVREEMGCQLWLLMTINGLFFSFLFFLCGIWTAMSLKSKVSVLLMLWFN